MYSGQLTSSGVSAIDFGHNNSKLSNMPASLREFVTLLSKRANGNLCWVSAWPCFDPSWAVDYFVLPQLRRRPNIKVLLRSVVIDTRRDQASGNVRSLQVVSRTFKEQPGESEWGAPLSSDLEDWYSPLSSKRFDKELLSVSAGVFIEGSEFGDVLATSGLNGVRLGVEVPDEGSAKTEPRCTQSATLTFFQAASELAGQDVPPGSDLGRPFSIGKTSWDQVWTYRRSLSPSGRSGPSPGDNTQQNFNGGNDYNEAALLVEQDDPAANGGWRGGVNVTALYRAEQRAYGYFHWYKQAGGNSFSRLLGINRTSTGTEHGLSKLPYMRDSRRPASGLGGFVLKFSDLCDQTASQPGCAAKPERFNDTVALGNYNADCHGLESGSGGLCPGYPQYIGKEVGNFNLAFYIPFRALTVAGAPNLLVAGKSIAATFKANAATRTHPGEWSTGAAAGQAAALMVVKGWVDTAEVLENVAVLQAALKRAGQPLDWQ
jgi:hypothetical protein